MFQLTKKRLLVGLGAAVLGAVTLNACMVQNKTHQVLAFAGSDTTQDAVEALVTQMNADVANTDPDTLVNIRALEPAPHTVPADGQCAAKTYHSPPGAGEIVAPFGSSNGRNALKASVLAGDGCIDIARSSGPPRAIGSDLASFEYYAYALDAMGWASASTHAPAHLTQAQLQSIYNCSVTNWSAVGGTAGPIKRYMPHTGSGTYQVFEGIVLGFDPTLFSSASCPAVIFDEENRGTLIASNGDQQTAIVGYSAGVWTAQFNGAAPDFRFGQVEHDYGTPLVVFSGGVASLNTAGPVNEGNVPLNNPSPSVPGIRYVFNVIDSTGVSYNDAKFFVGFENAPAGDSSKPTSSKLCNGTYASTISTQGFGPLNATVSSHNLLGSNCRLYTP